MSAFTLLSKQSTYFLDRISKITERERSDCTPESENEESHKLLPGVQSLRSRSVLSSSVIMSWLGLLRCVPSVSAVRSSQLQDFTARDAENAEDTQRVAFC